VGITDQANRQLLDAIIERSRSIAQSLRGLSDDELHQPSELSGWSRLTIACHLRFGADALSLMTRSALRGVPVAYYPEGREVQRPLTLVPHPGESAQDVVESLTLLSDGLDEEWSALDLAAWDLEVVEPKDNPDLGPIRLGRLPLLRLTEVEVHGTDLGLNLGDWSELFIGTVLPMRLEWLNIRRANHRAFDTELEGSWLLVADDGPTYRVRLEGPKVESRPASPQSQARAVIETNSRDLLALLLGRSLNSPPVIMGDIAFGQSFSLAFPGP
jgi:maleylpyruvate isomerase